MSWRREVDGGTGAKSWRCAATPVGSHPEGTEPRRLHPSLSHLAADAHEDLHERLRDAPRVGKVHCEPPRDPVDRALELPVPRDGERERRRVGVPGGPVPGVLRRGGVRSLVLRLGGRLRDLPFPLPGHGASRGAPPPRGPCHLRLLRIPSDPDPAPAGDLHISVHRHDDLPPERVLLREPQETDLSFPPDDPHMGEQPPDVPDGVRFVRRVLRRRPPPGGMEEGVPVGTASDMDPPPPDHRRRRCRPLRIEPARIRMAALSAPHDFPGSGGETPTTS